MWRVAAGARGSEIACVLVPGRNRSTVDRIVAVFRIARTAPQLYLLDIAEDLTRTSASRCLRVEDAVVQEKTQRPQVLWAFCEHFDVNLFIALDKVADLARLVAKRPSRVPEPATSPACV